MSLCFYCSQSFKNEFQKLIKKNQHIDLESNFIEFLGTEKKQIIDFYEGIKLGGNVNTDPCLIKKRRKGSGGYRIYYYIYLQNDEICFISLHPKTGKRGKANENEIKTVKNQFKKDRKNNELYIIKAEDGSILFEKQKIKDKVN